MKTILYIYGYLGSHNGSTVNSIKENLTDDVKLISFKYPQEDPGKAIEFLNEKVKEHNVDLVVGTSLGGYFALQLKGVKKILINPCVHPEIELEKLKDPDCPTEVANRYKDYINKHRIWEGHDKNEQKLTTVIFGMYDKLLGDKYWNEVGWNVRNTIFSNQGHNNTPESIKEKLIPTIYNVLNNEI